MKRDVATFVSRCSVYQQVKAEHQKSISLLQPLLILKWKWDHITMDFVTDLPRTSKGYDATWVIVDRLTKLVHFLLTKKTLPLNHLAKLYIEEIMKLHEISYGIVSNRNPKFTSHFWEALHNTLGTKLKFSVTFHLQTDEQTIKTLEDKLRACMLDFHGCWDDHICCWWNSLIKTTTTLVLG